MTRKFNGVVIVAYDTRDNERLVHICDTTQEMAQYFNSKKSTIQGAIYHKNLLKCRYKIERMNYTD